MGPKELKQEVRVLQVSGVCECGGKLIATGTAYPVAPMIYEHRCDKCKKTHDIINKSYPYIEYETY